MALELPDAQLASSQSQLAHCVAQLAERLEAGEPVDLEAICADCPHHCEQLEMLLPTMQAVVELDASLGASAAPARLDRSERGDEVRGQLGDFRLVRELGRGGMGVVYEAEQLSLGRRVALKVLPFAAMLDRQQLNRFKNEARAAGTLDHPNIVAIHSVGVERGVHYYAMHLVEGESLAQVITRLRKESKASVVSGQLSVGKGCPAPSPRGGVLGRGEGARTSDELAQTELLPTTDHGRRTTDTVPVAALSTVRDHNARDYFRTAAKLGIQAAEALDHAHQNGILHRDVKPANLMVECSHLAPRDESIRLAEQGGYKLWITDFGLARMEQEAGMTMTGDLLGTLRYMSPEQALAKRVVVDHRSDIYSLGATLYELLTLEPPFPADDRQELLRQIAFEEPRKPRQHNSRIPQDLETIVLKAIEKNPAQRYATAADLAADLRRYLGNEPIKAKPLGWRGRAMKWARRHPAGVRAATITALITTTVLAGSIGWVTRDRAAQRTIAETAAQSALDEAERLIAESNWNEALSSIKRAEVVLAGLSPWGAVSERVRALRKDVDMVLRLDDIRSGPATETPHPAPESGEGEPVYDPETDRKYGQAFAEYGIDVETLSRDASIQRIKQCRIALELTTALDVWADWRRSIIPGDQSWKQLVEIARAADPDPWRNRLREMLGTDLTERQAAVIRLAESNASGSLPSPTVLLLVGLLEEANARDKAAEYLRAVQRVRPDDFWINMELGELYGSLQPPQNDEAIRFFTAALASRPSSAVARNNLGVRLAAAGLNDDAFEMYQSAALLKPTSVVHISNFGRELQRRGRFDEAIVEYKSWIRTNANEPWVHYLLGTALLDDGQVDEAVASFNEAVRLQPDLAEGHMGLGRAFQKKGRIDDAIASFREAIRIEPSGTLIYAALGELLLTKGLVNDAVDYFKEFAQRDPDNHAAGVRAAYLLLIADDRAGYEAICQQMLDRFGATEDGEAARRTCWACLIASPPVGDMEQLVRLADLAARNPSIPSLAYRERGLAAYRAGDWQGALDWSAKSRAQITDGNMHARDYRAECFFVEAMALRHLGKSGEARDAYDEAMKLTGEEFPNPDQGIKGAGGKWLDWACIELLRREAEALLEITTSEKSTSDKTDAAAKTSN
jgi:serine/threonine protein kinase/Flp pilus assembly protein TadD